MALKELGSKEDYTEYGAWLHGVAVRVFAHPDMDASVVVSLHGWASAETLAAHDRGEVEVWPEFFYTSCLDGNGVDYREQPVAGGKVPVSELERYRAELPGASTLDYAWSFVLDRVERAL